MKAFLDVSAKLTSVAFAAALAGCGAPPGGTSKPSAVQTAPPAASNPDLRRVSQMVGQDLAKQIEPVRAEIDLDVAVEALRATLAGKAPLPPEQVDAVRRNFTQRLRKQQDAAQAALAAKNQQDSDAFLAENGGKAGVTTTASGLQYEVLRAGDGPKPRAADTVEIDYVGRLRDGRKFEDTYVIGHSAQLVLNRVLPGLAEALPLMPVGAQYRFWVPPKLAYGAQGKAGEIEPNALLTFEIELLAIAGVTPRPPNQE